MSFASSKKVSIVIPLYNGSNYLKEAIDSALDQTYENVEVVVINDGSTDGGATEKIAKSYKNRIKYYKKENGGVATALNYGIEKMTGEYFSWLSHDDMYDKAKIKEQMKCLSRCGDKNTIVACEARVLFESGVTKKEKIDKELFGYFDIFLAISGDVGVNGCSLLIPRSALIEAKGFDKNLPVTQDYDLWFRLSKTCNFILLEKDLVISRRHNEQDSVQKLNLCLEAGDKLHYDFLNDIKYERFESYIEKAGIDKAWSKYTIYKNAGFYKTSSMILKNILEYYKSHDVEKYKDAISKEIGVFSNLNKQQINDKKKSILFYSNVWRMGGVERVTSYLFNNFGDQYDIFLVINNDNSEIEEGYSIPKAVNIIRVNNDKLLAELMNVITLFDIDLFVGNPNFVSDFIDIYSKMKGSRTKSVAYNHIHFLLPYTIERLYPVALKQDEAFSKADKVVWISKTACDVYNIDNNNGVYIPNPISISKKIRSKSSPNKKIIAVGRFGEDEVKRIDRLIKVFSEIIKIDPDYSLDIVGHCNENIPIIQHDYIRLADYIEKLGIPKDKVKIHGHQKNVNKYYDKSDILILTSTYEGFALVLAEAMSRGLPCACFDYVGLNELVQDGFNGVVAKQDDNIGLAEKIVGLVNDKNSYANFSKNALRSIDKFDERIFVNRWQLLIDYLIDGDNKAIDVLIPENSITELDKKIIHEYKNIIRTTITGRIRADNELQVCMQQPQVSESFFRKNIARSIRCLKNHGVLFTIKTLFVRSFRKIKSIAGL